MKFLLIHYSQIEDAHHTSAKYQENTSEFDQTKLEEEYKIKIEVPFVKNSPVQLACSYVNEYHIEENDTLMIVGQIEHIFIQNERKMEILYMSMLLPIQ